MLHKTMQPLARSVQRGNAMSQQKKFGAVSQYGINGFHPKASPLIGFNWQKTPVNVAASVGGSVVPDGHIFLITVYLSIPVFEAHGSPNCGGLYVLVQYVTSTLYVVPALQNVTLIVASALPPGQSAQPGVSLADTLTVAKNNIVHHSPATIAGKLFLMDYTIFHSE